MGMKPNPSQYPGTLKRTWCKTCLKQLDNMTPTEQEIHGEQCKLQTKLGLYFE